MKLEDFIKLNNYKGFHIISTCESCEHNKGCDIQSWNNSRSDVKPEDEFGCIHWSEKK